MKLTIRRETKTDFRRVEEITREAFWNLYVPGCDEHFLAHVLRDCSDFIPELDLVIELDGEVIGNIMYTKSWLENEVGERIETITFGPVSVLPDYQRKGIGSRLIRYSIELAKELGHKAIIIFGDPHNYCKHGFISAKKLKISDLEGRFPYAMLVLELEEGALQNKDWKYISSLAYNISPEAAEEFDKQFEPKKKVYRYTQEEFSISCSAYID